MPDKPAKIRGLIRYANQVNRLPQPKLRVLLNHAMDAVELAARESGCEECELPEAMSYLTAVTRSLHPIHAEDAKVAFLKAANAIRLLKIRQGPHWPLNIKGAQIYGRGSDRERERSEACFIDCRLVFPYVVAGEVHVLPGKRRQAG